MVTRRESERPSTDGAGPAAKGDMADGAGASDDTERIGAAATGDRASTGGTAEETDEVTQLLAELWALLRDARTKVEERLRTAAGEPADGSSCPLCAVLDAARGSRSGLAELFVDLLRALRETWCSSECASAEQASGAAANEPCGDTPGKAEHITVHRVAGPVVANTATEQGAERLADHWG